MILFLIIYILGSIATIALYYLSLEKGYRVTVSEIALLFGISILSWIAFIIYFTDLFADFVVFTKK